MRICILPEGRQGRFPLPVETDSLQRPTLMNVFGWRIERRTQGPQTVEDALRQLLRKPLPSDHVDGLVVVYVLPENEMPMAEADPENDEQRSILSGSSILCVQPSTNVKRLRLSVKAALNELDDLADMEGRRPMGFLKGRG